MTRPSATKATPGHDTTDFAPCGNCGGLAIWGYTFNHYRPKESVVKCHDCGFFVPIKGSQRRVLMREWKKESERMRNVRGI